MDDDHDLRRAEEQWQKGDASAIWKRWALTFKSSNKNSGRTFRLMIDERSRCLGCSRQAQPSFSPIAQQAERLSGYAPSRQILW